MPLNFTRFSSPGTPVLALGGLGLGILLGYRAGQKPASCKSQVDKATMTSLNEPYYDRLFKHKHIVLLLLQFQFPHGQEKVVLAVPVDPEMTRDEFIKHVESCGGIKILHAKFAGKDICRNRHEKLNKTKALYFRYPHVEFPLWHCWELTKEHLDQRVIECLVAEEGSEQVRAELRRASQISKSAHPLTSAIGREFEDEGIYSEKLLATPFRVLIMYKFISRVAQEQQLVVYEIPILEDWTVGKLADHVEYRGGLKLSRMTFGHDKLLSKRHATLQSTGAVYSLSRFTLCPEWLCWSFNYEHEEDRDKVIFCEVEDGNVIDEARRRAAGPFALRAV